MKKNKRKYGNCYFQKGVPREEERLLKWIITVTTMNNNYKEKNHAAEAEDPANKRWRLTQDEALPIVDTNPLFRR